MTLLVVPDGVAGRTTYLRYRLHLPPRSWPWTIVWRAGSSISSRISSA